MINWENVINWEAVDNLPPEALKELSEILDKAK